MTLLLFAECKVKNRRGEQEKTERKTGSNPAFSPFFVAE